MKRLICLLITLGVFFSFAGCQKTGMLRPDFPLEEEVVTAALEETGLPGLISEDETQSYTEGHIMYTLRNEDQRLVMDISSSCRNGSRFLKISYILPPVPEGPAFAWVDWKQQFVFAALLFGGFADKEEIYRAFAEQNVEGGKMPPKEGVYAEFIAERYEWDACLPAGYCRVYYELFNSSIENGPPNTIVVAQSPRMYVDIYESESHYQEMQQRLIEAKETADASRSTLQN